MKTGLIDLPLQPIIEIEKAWLPPHAFAPNPSNPMESEMLPIDQVFRTVQVLVDALRGEGLAQRQAIRSSAVGLGSP